MYSLRRDLRRVGEGSVKQHRGIEQKSPIGRCLNFGAVPHPTVHEVSARHAAALDTARGRRGPRSPGPPHRRLQQHVARRRAPRHRLCNEALRPLGATVGAGILVVGAQGGLRARRTPWRREVDRQRGSRQCGPYRQLGLPALAEDLRLPCTGTRDTAVRSGPPEGPMLGHRRAWRLSPPRRRRAPGRSRRSPSLARHVDERVRGPNPKPQTPNPKPQTPVS